MREFRQSKGRTSRPVVWQVAVEGNQVHITWGQLDGKTQTTTQTFEGVNIGKANEKSPQMVAAEFADRQILSKTRQGFKEYNPETGEPFEGDSPDSITSFIHLPPNLRFYKPQNTLPAYLEKKIEEGVAWFVRKRNGEMIVAACGEDQYFRLYSSKLLICHKDEEVIPWSDRFPHIVEVLESLNIPPRTIILGELVSGRGVDNLYRVGSIMKSLTERALDLQEGDPLWFCMWDIAFREGDNLLTTYPYRYRMGLIRQIRGRAFEKFGDRSYLCTPEVFESIIHGRDEMLEHAKKRLWEGFVVVDPDVPYGDKAISFHGKPERPKFCGKLKPSFEADFIARWDPANGIGTYGKGKKSGGIGAVFLYLWDPEIGEEVFISKCGGGLLDKDVHGMANPGLFPMVWQVEFAAWTPKGSIQFPEFVRIRDDKTMLECTVDQQGDAGVSL